MILLIMFLIQGGTAPGDVPELGVRISAWFIGMFLLAVGGALIYLRMKELEDERKSKHS